jgi:hypothetical protein
MGYIYRLPSDFSLIPNVKKVNFDYLPVKKKEFPMIRDLSIYSKNEYGEGIFALGSVLSSSEEKSSELKLENNNLINRNMFQVKIHLAYICRFPWIYIKHLKHFPTYNTKWFEKPYNPYKLYWACSLNSDIKYLFSTFWYDFFENNVVNHYDYSHLWKYYVHLLRERCVKNYWHLKIPLNTKECRICGYKSDVPYFLEIHDTIDINFDKDYIPINKNDFIVVCPNCHKNIHLNMHNNKN